MLPIWQRLTCFSFLFLPAEGKSPAPESENGKNSERGGARGAERGGAGEGRGGGGRGNSLLIWLVVLGLLGVWSSVALVHLDLVDYNSLIGKWAGVRDGRRDGRRDYVRDRLIVGTRSNSSCCLAVRRPASEKSLRGFKCWLSLTSAAATFS